LLASYDQYLDAQAAVDKLSDNHFPVAGVSIIGVDLRLIEIVVGRMSWGRAAAGGLFAGAWFGLLLGIFVSFFARSEEWSPTTLIILGLLYGAAFGIVFGLVSYAMTGGKRDFMSRSQIGAARYDVHVDASTIAQARQILGIGQSWPPAGDQQAGVSDGSSGTGSVAGG
ncbi:MAG: hypothetical protein Q8P61_07525, partial [Candidatus Nanopelagicales bacterium]|nr:hypothetical protein [Candidatus Nanopelagicales bacterium]